MTLDLSLALAVSCRTVMCSLGRRGRGAVDACPDGK